MLRSRILDFIIASRTIFKSGEQCRDIDYEDLVVEWLTFRIKSSVAGLNVFELYGELS